MYVHCEDNPTLHRRTYHIIDQNRSKFSATRNLSEGSKKGNNTSSRDMYNQLHDNIVLVHYLDTRAASEIADVLSKKEKTKMGTSPAPPVPRPAAVASASTTSPTATVTDRAPSPLDPSRSIVSMPPVPSVTQAIDQQNFNLHNTMMIPQLTPALNPLQMFPRQQLVDAANLQSSLTEQMHNLCNMIRYQPNQDQQYINSSIRTSLANEDEKNRLVEMYLSDSAAKLTALYQHHQQQRMLNEQLKADLLRHSSQISRR